MDATLDEALIERIAARDQGAMSELYARHSGRAYRFLVRLVRDPSLAEDLLGDTFVEVWQGAGRFEGRSSVGTWLLSIARFKALSALRRRPHQELEPEAAEMIEDEADTPEVIAQKTSKGEALRRCLGRLSADHREVVSLVYYQELSVEEVATVLGIPEGTVKTRMFHARKRLSEMLRTAGIERGWP